MAVRSVVVAVSPRLLGDVVRRALELDGLVVQSVDADTTAEWTYDLALVTPGRENDARASAIVTVDPDAMDLDALRALIRGQGPAA